VKWIKIAVVGLISIPVITFVLFQIPQVQDTLFRIVAPRAMNVDFGESENLRVFVCGTASPLGNTPDRAQACIAIITPEHFYVFDAGAGSAARLLGGGLPLARLDGVFLTHFHSDHISDLPGMALNSWVLGRATPLTVFGPRGINQIIEGLNTAYHLDRSYRTAHHGADFMPLELGDLQGAHFEPGAVLELDGLKITSFMVEHNPISPAVGYRIDYRGRSVVISGDSIVSAGTFEVAQGTDLLIHDALSQDAIRPLIDTADALGRDRTAKIMRDVVDYHADVKSLEAASRQANVGQLVLYHMVPTPVNPLLLKIWNRNLADTTIMAEDNMLFELPVGNKTIRVQP
tara:strand:+ start:33759 stop:34793 length:1035 start_codon:yes stop_codon:yes gene_type:complete